MEELRNNFIHDIIDADLEKNPELKIHTRFPPEPNGYLHIGSAKAIWINSQTAKKYGGLFNLRYDDTNPAKEGDEFVRSIYEDLTWLGAEPTGGVFYGSDYFERCYEFALKLIRQGDAYVCDLSAEEMREDIASRFTWKARDHLTWAGDSTRNNLARKCETYAQMRLDAGDLANLSAPVQNAVDVRTVYTLEADGLHGPGSSWSLTAPSSSVKIL